MYPQERSLVQNLKSLPFEIIGVNSDVEFDNLGNLERALKEESITWRSFQNDRGENHPSISEDRDVQGWRTGN